MSMMSTGELWFLVIMLLVLLAIVWFFSMQSDNMTVATVPSDSPEPEPTKKPVIVTERVDQGYTSYAVCPECKAPCKTWECNRGNPSQITRRSMVCALCGHTGMKLAVGRETKSITTVNGNVMPHRTKIEIEFVRFFEPDEEPTNNPELRASEYMGRFECSYCGAHNKPEEK